ncbi:MAG: hypothetical protein KGM43_12350 [Planctomycetota bacterium]|nr:hypothetical protein [Planctomycetota bacterium]
MIRARRVEIGVFVILLASYAYFWLSRDWNSASRLVLTYALVDRGTASIDGMERQTGDIAFYRGRYYSDKGPGFSLLALPAYALLRASGTPPHPLGGPALAYWSADYGTTLGTSGVLTALCAAILVAIARELGCGPRRAALVGLAYGLATPAYVYACLAYGHQAAACALLGAFALLRRVGTHRDGARVCASGALAAYAAVVELQVGPVSAILGCDLVLQVLSRRRRASSLAYFALGAAGPTLLMLVYDWLVFASPLDMGYFHLVTTQYREVHSQSNPLGLRRLDWSRARSLLWGTHRGLLYYAPIVAAAVPGWAVLASRKAWHDLVVTLASCAAVFAVNLSYPAWTGGWTTGPRLLLPMIPFACVAASALLAVGGRAGVILAALLAVVGAILNTLFLGVGGRLPAELLNPLAEVVWPLWRGDPVPLWRPGAERFAVTIPARLLTSAVRALPSRWAWVQFVPLWLLQAGSIAVLLRPNKPHHSQASKESSP